MENFAFIFMRDKRISYVIINTWKRKKNRKIQKCFQKYLREVKTLNN